MYSQSKAAQYDIPEEVEFTEIEPEIEDGDVVLLHSMTLHSTAETCLGNVVLHSPLVSEISITTLVDMNTYKAGNPITSPQWREFRNDWAIRCSRPIEQWGVLYRTGPRMMGMKIYLLVSNESL